MSSTSLAVSSSNPLNDFLQKFWNIEEITPPIFPTTDDQFCEELSFKTTNRDTNGRFCVALPFRDSTLPNSSKTVENEFLSSHGLGDSRSLALKRFFNLEHRLNKDAELYDAYRRFMNEYKSLGHMQLAKQTGKYFIPHHAVVKREGDINAKLRVVFDASAPTSSGKSLIDVLCAGPKMQNDITDILLKCRLWCFVFTTDIVKMYRQIIVEPDDRLFQHIFWRNSPHEEIQEYQLLTVTYGVTTSPYLAIRCLHELDNQEGSRYPAAKRILTDMTYVDNIIVGANTITELCQRQDDIIGLLQSCGCDLKKWTSNCRQLLERVSPPDRTQCLSFDPKDELAVKVLGLHRDPTSDIFAYHTVFPPVKHTKRNVLSTIARLFDPIGILGLTLLWAKSFMQRLWQEKLDWDTPLPDNLSSEWEVFVTELSSLHKIALQRHIDVRDPVDIQLLGFSDASQRGYVATVYLRVVHASGDINVSFITCKTKVAPLKTCNSNGSLSIPRLELYAAVLLSQTLLRVFKVLSGEINISCVRAWTDSTIVLSWLTTDQTTFKVFVTKRVAKIHQLLPDCKWAYINTIENPADPASRGLLPSAMVTCKLHQSGLAFLRLPEDQWPTSTFISVNPKNLPETKSVPALLSVTNNNKVNDSHPDDLYRFSSWSRLLRSLAYALRFIVIKRPTNMSL